MSSDTSGCGTTTTFRLWSDLHLESGTWKEEWFDNSQGQYLILAGDINEVRKHKHIMEFFKRCNESFVKTFYVPGNHEFWDAYVEKWEWAADQFRLAGFDNIICLQQSSFELEDIEVFGATLWYDASHLNNGMPRIHLKQESKDYQYIGTNRRGTWNGLRPSDVIYWNVQHTLWLEQVVPASTKKKLVITHHAPTPFSKDPTWDDDHAEYVNDLDLSKIPADVWVHGHVHYSHWYIVDDVTVMTNPRGYELYNAVNSRFNPQFTFEL